MAGVIDIILVAGVIIIVVTKALKHSRKVELARGMANFTSLLNSVKMNFLSLFSS